MSAERKFKATIQKQGSRCFLAIPFDPDEAWGPKRRHYLSGTIDGKKTRATVEAFGDVMGISLGPVWLRDNGLEQGVEVEVVLRPEGPQSSAMAPDMAAAFEAEPKAAEFFDSLATFYRNNFMRWIDSAQRPETRAARIREAIALLKDGKRQK